MTILSHDEGVTTSIEHDDGDSVFRALADRHRRTLLDALRDLDGQTLSELCDRLPDLTRFGVMKHLTVLTDARLVTTRRAGRKKHHYLNPVPIRSISERWLSRFQAGWADAIGDLKHDLEAAASAAAPAGATTDSEPVPEPISVPARIAEGA